MQKTVESLLDDFHERPLPELVPRTATFARVRGKANVITGIRRSGKTWFCYQTMRELIDDGLPKERLLYLNFEDDRLLPFTVQDFQGILDLYYRKFPAFKDQKCYFYLDEAQRIAGWDHFVRRALDTENIAVCVTGSSSKLLSTEIAVALRGRSLTTEIFPFSFTEYLRLKKMDVTYPPSGGSRTRALLQHHLESYLETGGFPDVLEADEETRQQILRTYVDVVVLRDVIERYKVRNVTALRALTRHVLAAPANRISVNKTYNSFRSEGIACTKNDLYAYLDHLSEAYLCFAVPIASRSENIRRVNPAKYYAADTGILKAVTLRKGEDRGAYLENLVFLHLRRQGIFPSYYLTKSGQEVDFTWTDPRSRRKRLMQVCWGWDDAATRERELSALRMAMKETGLSKATIVTWMEEKDVDVHIDVIPAWRYLLSEAG